MTTLNDFMKNAKGLAKNPLGIIALFISLIYGFACLVLGLTSNNLNGDEKIPLIWFLVLFPVLVLIAFVYLVAYHHKKLYAPSDFRDDISFLKASGNILKEKKIIKEYNEFSQEALVEVKAKHEEPVTNDEKDEFLENNEKPKTIEFDDFKNLYLQIERKALAYLEMYFGFPVNRNIRIKGMSFIVFDGIIETNNELIVIEIKYLRSNSSANIRLDQLKKTYSELVKFAESGRLDRKLQFLIFFVIEHMGLFPLINETDLLSKFEESKVDLLIQTIYLETLNKEVNGT